MRVCVFIYRYRYVYTQDYKERAQVILTRIVHVISRQTIASDSIRSITCLGIAACGRGDTLSEIGLTGIVATRDVIKTAKGCTHSKGIATEHSSP